MERTLFRYADDLYDHDTSFAEFHVLPALIRKFVDARRVSDHPQLFGEPVRQSEFLFVDDLADA